MMLNDLGYPYKFMWKTKIPQKIKIFLWLAIRNSILTKVNLVRRGWKGPVSCHFCGAVETIDHLFVSCSTAKLIWNILLCALNFDRKPESVKDLFGEWIRKFNKRKKGLIVVRVDAVLWSIWNVRNEICFENKEIHDPIFLIHRVPHMITSWAILQLKQENIEKLIWGAKLLERVTSEIFSAS